MICDLYVNEMSLNLFNTFVSLLRTYTIDFDKN